MLLHHLLCYDGWLCRGIQFDRGDGICMMWQCVGGMMLAHVCFASKIARGDQKARSNIEEGDEPRE